MFVSYSAGQSGGLLFWASLAKSNLDSIMPSLVKMGCLGEIGKNPDFASSGVIHPTPSRLELSLP
jgi:hypothetical protein